LTLGKYPAMSPRSAAEAMRIRLAKGEDPSADQARQLRQEADADKQTFAALREMFLTVQGSGKDHSHRQ
jgi:hypothetical protein